MDASSANSAPAPLSRGERGAFRAPGTYLTDGRSLFRVARIHPDCNSETLVELEDCRTLELVVLPAEGTLEGRLHTVEPRP